MLTEEPKIADAPGDRVLKRDLFGQVRLHQRPDVTVIRRDTTAAAWWLRPLARHLAAREAAALAEVEIDGVPKVIGWDGALLDREWIAGQPMQVARPKDNVAYFAAALTLLRRLHRAGIAHNDTAKEPNWLVREDGSPALVDFQIAMQSRRRGRLFRVLAREDLRHLLKHKRTYAPDALTASQRRMLATPAWPARIWKATVKPLYLFLTRRVLGWSDREGAGDRGSS